MDDAGPVGLGEAVRELRAEVEQLGEGQGPGPEPPPQRLPFDVLDHDVVRARHVRGRADVVDVDDVRVVEGGGGACLLVEPLEELRVGAGAQHLDGDSAAEARVARAVHLAHAARTQAIDDFVGADAGSGSEGVLHRLSSVDWPRPSGAGRPISRQRTTGPAPPVGRAPCSGLC